ncbi:hypothetical protein [Tatumella sp. JGM118]|uniref:hypothetical protein n=1 Tax=Tatumella sp. JGM118 TaxID=2799796 RepID=UPI001BAF45E8|nr:hypothetical protein [Tatumella sp. JGM118]MBS0910564.1 hypothetical protein [Tatumella sp. JGM118]
MKFEAKKIIRDNDKIIVGAFIGGIIMTVVFIILKWTSDTKFKDMVSPILNSITIFIGLFTAAKVLKWHEVRKNDKGFEVAQSLVMTFYKCISNILFLQKLMDDITPYIEERKISEKRINRIEHLLNNETEDFRKNISILNSLFFSLEKWSIKIKNKDIFPVNELVEAEEICHKFLDSVVYDTYTIRSLNELSSKWKFQSQKLDMKTKELNKLKIDDIFKFND